MLKVKHLFAYPQAYHDMFLKFYNGSTIRDFINETELLPSTLGITDQDSIYKFKGDSLEILSEIFFKLNENDPSFGIRQYEPIPLDDDYGVDAKGLNPVQDIAMIQVKYRFNPEDAVTYAEIARTYTSGVIEHKLDPYKSKTVFIFTTAYDVTPPCIKVFGDKLVVVNRNIIARHIDNNVAFWQNAYKEVFETLDN